MSTPLFYLADVAVMPPEQLVDQPLDFSAWASIGSPTVTAGYADPDGGTGAYRIGLVAGSYIHGKRLLVTCAATTDHTFSICMKPVTSTASWIFIFTTAYASYKITWATLEVSEDSTYNGGERRKLTPVPLSDGWYRLTIVANVDNLTGCYFYIMPVAEGADTGSVDVYQANAWQTPLPMPRTSSTGYATTTLRFANRHFITSSADTPANTMWDARLKQPVVVSRDAWNGGRTTGRSRTAYGDLVLLNGDGALDYLLYCGVDARALAVKYSTLVAPTYVSGFTNLFTGTMQGVEVAGDTVTIKVRDRQTELDVPLQGTRYAGDNALPDGLEGVDDLKDTPKPLVFGQVTNISPPQVNTSRLIYQVNDGPIFALSAVYDRGAYIGDSITEWEESTITSGAYFDAAFGASNWVVISGIFNPAYSTDNGSSFTSGTGGAAANGVCYSTACAAFLSGGTVAMRKSVDDGVTWTSVVTPFSAGACYDVAFGDGKWLACGTTGQMHYSTDLSVWTTVTAGFGSSGIHEVIYGRDRGGPLFVCCGEGGKIAYSTDASVWTQATLPASVTGVLRSIAYGNGAFVAGGVSGWVVTSVERETWTVADANVSTGEVYGIAYGDGKFVLVTYENDLAYATDPSRWQLLTSPQPAGNIDDIAFGNHRFLILPAGTSYKVRHSKGPVVYTTSTDILDDTQAPAAGSYGVWATGGMFRLGSTPAGTITADVIQGASAGNRTVGGIFSAIMAKAGVTNYSTADVSVLDVATSAACGLFLDCECNVSDVLDDLAESVGAWWGGDIGGVIRMKQLVAPQAYPAYAPDVYVTRDDLLAPVERVVANDVAIPPYRVTVRYGRNYTVQEDVAGITDAARRSVLAREWMEVAASDTAVQTKHPLAPVLTIDTLFATAAGASSEASRVLTLRKRQRDTVRIVVPLNEDTAILDLNFQVLLTYPRYGYDTGDSALFGKMLRVVAVEPDVARGTLALTLWG